MKTNLDKFFACNDELENEGIWVQLSDDCSFKVKRFGGSNQDKIKLYQAKYLKPYARQIEKGILDAKKERSLYTKVFVDSCMVDWKGVVDEDTQEVIEYSKENAYKLFEALPDLFDFVVAESLKESNYREDLGNS